MVNMNWLKLIYLIKRKLNPTKLRKDNRNYLVSENIKKDFVNKN